MISSMMQHIVSLFMMAFSFVGMTVFLAPETPEVIRNGYVAAIFAYSLGFWLLILFYDRSNDHELDFIITWPISLFLGVILLLISKLTKRAKDKNDE